MTHPASPARRRRGPDSAPSRGRRPRARRPHESEEQRTARIERRRALVPSIAYPQALPVSAAREEIAAAIRDHQVVVVAGETGSGKTTQLPKICLELGRGLAGTIGHTQPRRIAARSVAERIAEELDVELGEQVGYQVRFTDHANRDTLVKVMTDGILLSEMQRDRDLRRYDTLIIDEAHERSLNIDFILGYLKQLLPRRPDLKVIITSATIDPEKFAQHFARDGVPAPIIEVSGRTYPVELRYRPLVRTDGEVEVDVDQVTGIVEAVEELWTETPRDGRAQDVLVFCSGEREIRDAADALRGLDLPQTEILPLYARLSAAEQHRVFSRHSGRRVVLATNVAETSLTVPGIRYVVDTGTARISRYSQRTKVQRLPIEPVSQASAQQRSGRCGRVAEGICIRLYSEEDFQARPEFTDPEILRTSLASVILQMTSLGLGDVARFPFVDPPDARQVTDGVRLLEELGALDPEAVDPRKRLTAYGRTLAALPVDPRMARMLVAAAENGSLHEVLVIVAGLSIQDVRERPAESQAQADQAHARFKDEHSDFISYLNLWRYLKEQQKELSGSAFRRMCKREYLHYLRIREWQDLHTQLRQACKQQHLTLNDNEASPDTVHQALLTGLLSHIGLRDRDRRDYLGARNARFSIQPGSTLFRRQPDWVMAAELVETTRLWARVNARTDPAWVERAAGHLVKRSYAEPHWERKQGSAMALERVTLYGVPLVAGRKVPYGRVDPHVSRELFIRHALVEGDWETRHRFFADNQALLRRLSDLEARARRRDLLVDDETLVQFYDERIPESVVSATHFDTWWKTASRQTPDLLTYSEELLVSDDAQAVDESQFPKSWRQGDLRLRLTYQFEPGEDADGVTVHIPVEQLNQIEDTGFDWLVPGMREELAVALIKSLPKATRRSFVPAPDHARAALAQTDPADGAITDELAGALTRRTGVRLPPQEWDWSRVPDHLRMTFRIEDRRRRPLGEGKDLSVLKEQLAGQVRSTMARAAASVEREGLRQWAFGDLPETFETKQGRQTIQGFPAVVDRGDTVAVEVLPSRAESDEATRLGVRRLLLLNTDVPWKRILGLLTNAQRLALGSNPHGDLQAMLDDALACALDAVVADQPGGAPRTPAGFEEALRSVKQLVVPRVIEVVDLLVPVLNHYRELDLALGRMTPASVASLREDVRAQLDHLVYPGFVAGTGLARLRDLDRYLRAALERLDKAPADMARDQERAEVVRRVEQEREDLLAELPAARRSEPAVVELRWMVEELRVSLFAQRLGTAYPVSEKRVYKAMDAV
ncbi:ATP-dependent RNA helicase HrpA [Luteipulveratus sp. YIM 133132]|uniref:ATP-dependent RNA helicase HrpA n=1 Tax=Luteipulveratus flavus TaxID=3031728 RepID=UPI0023AEEE89|nr:ATP-dependent RNA helicase HrpA [Luteipulveratus sp. YIM 133132]MDE9366126.1 ATP-dependent RNA helicase HrpA [Luteipulveratus sp. YIM 133132]